MDTDAVLVVAEDSRGALAPVGCGLSGTWGQLLANALGVFGLFARPFRTGRVESFAVHADVDDDVDARTELANAKLPVPLEEVGGRLRARAVPLGDDEIESVVRLRCDGVFDQFTGATVTPRAVVRAVRNALLYFEENSEELLALPPPEEDEVLIIDPAVPEIPDHVTPTERLPEAEPPGGLLQ